jgi:RES domain-containing protein
MPALYLALSIDTAIKEANRGFAFKINPSVLCSYDVDCEDVADLRTDAGRSDHRVDLAELSGAWLSDVLDGKDPSSWRMARRLVSGGYAGILVPSIAPGATSVDQNLVLWNWAGSPPHQVNVFDPSGRLPQNQLSWG